jgi:hypothetical protein
VWTQGDNDATHSSVEEYCLFNTLYSTTYSPKTDGAILSGDAIFTNLGDHVCNDLLE